MSKSLTDDVVRELVSRLFTKDGLLAIRMCIGVASDHPNADFDVLEKARRETDAIAVLLDLAQEGT